MLIAQPNPAFLCRKQAFGTGHSPLVTGEPDHSSWSPLGLLPLGPKSPQRSFPPGSIKLWPPGFMKVGVTWPCVLHHTSCVKSKLELSVAWEEAEEKENSLWHF